MGLGGVAIAILPSTICLKLTFSDGLGGGCKKSPRPVNIDANHLLTQHHESAQPGAVCLLLHSRVFLCYK